jgi:hypothetical protein
MLTPHQSRLAEQASTEMDSGKLMHLIAELCRAIDSEREENRLSRTGCVEDCREHEPALAANPSLLIGSLEAPSLSVPLAIPPAN